MKNLAKYLSLFLVLAVLASVFTFAAFADEPAAQAETTVGEYTLPNGAWTPNDTDYPDIAYGVWASEADFLGGNAPSFWYQNTNSSDTATYVTDAKAKGAGVPLTTGNIATTDKTNFKAEYVSASFVPGYVHVYKDVEISSASQILIGANQKLTVCLGGKTLTMNNGWLIGPTGSCPNAALTLKDGKVVYSSGQTQPRPDTTMVWKNLDVTVTHGGSIVYDGGANLIQYEDCIINANDPGLHFFISDGDYRKGDEIKKVNFINTDVNYTTAPTGEIFRFSESYLQYDISYIELNIDKDCSFSNIPADKWLRLTEGFSPGSYNGTAMTASYKEEWGKFTHTQTLNFEIGVQFKNGSVPPTSYTFYDILFDESIAASLEASKASTESKGGTLTTTTKSVYDIAVRSSDELAKIQYVDSTTKEPLTGDWYLVYDEATDSYSVKANLIGYSAVILDETGKVVSKAWTGENIIIPEADFDADGIVMLNPETGEALADEVYFVYDDTSAAYTVKKDLSEYKIVDIDLETNVIYKTWTEAILTSADASTALDVRNGAYLKFLSDITVQYITIKQDWDITFDLNGYTFSRASNFGNFQLGLSMSGGYYSHRDVRFISSNPDKRGTLDLKSTIQSRPGTNLYFENLDIVVSSSLISDGGSQVISMKDCSVTSTSGGYISSTDGEQQTSWKKVRVFDNVTFTKIGLYNVYAHIKNDIVEFNVINGCVVDSSYPLINLSSSLRTGTTYPTEPTAPRILNIDSDTKFTSAPYLCKVATEVEGIHSTVSTFYEDITVNYVNDFSSDKLEKKLTVSFGEKISDEEAVMLLEGNYYVVKNIKALDGVDLAFTITTPGSLATGYVTKYDAETGDAIITCSDIISIPVGGTITFYRDLKYDPEGSTQTNGRVEKYKDNITFDLNSYTFTINHRWQLGSPYTDCKKLYFKNGTVTAPAATDNLFFGNPGPEAVLTFDNVHLSTTKGNIFQLYNGSVIMNGGSLTAEGLNAINFNTNAFHHLELNGVTVKASVLLSKVYVEGTENTYEINGCDITVTNSVFVTAIKENKDYTVAEGSYVNINISDSEINGNLFSGNDKISGAFFNFTVSETGFSQKPQLDDKATLAYADGQTLVGVNDIWRVQSFKPTVGSNLQVNLSLSTDFNVNFHANPEVVLGVYLDGALLPSSEWDGSVKYTATFAAHQAADALAFEVWVKSGEDTYKIPLNYSVLTYAKKLTATNGVSDGAKDLAEAAIAYVKEAYKVAKIELPADLADFATDITASAEGTLPEQLTDAVASIRFELASSVNLIVEIADTYAGNTIVVNGKVYNVAAGDVVTVDMKAKVLADVITVSAGDKTAEFTLAGYVNSSAVQGTDMEALVEALYTYCYYAKVYADSPDGAELK